MNLLRSSLILIYMMAFSAVLQADDYQIEAALGFNSFKPDLGEDSKSTNLNLNYYLDPVATEGLPLGEAAFLGRNDNVSLHALKNNDSDYKQFELGVEWWFDNVYTSVIALKEDDPDYDNQWLQVGYMLDENVLASIVLINFKDRDDYRGVRFKLVNLTDNHDVGLEAIILRVSGRQTSIIKGEYFISSSLSAGLIINNCTGCGTSQTFLIKNFFTPRFSGELTYKDDEDYTETKASLALRF